MNNTWAGGGGRSSQGWEEAGKQAAVEAWGFLFTKASPSSLPSHSNTENTHQKKQACVHAHTHTCTLTHAHTCTHAPTGRYMCTHMYTLTHVYTHTHTHQHIDTRT